MMKQESFGAFIVNSIYDKYIVTALESKKERNMKMTELQSELHDLNNEIKRLKFESETIKNANKFLIKENKKLELKLNRLKNILT